MAGYYGFNADTSRLRFKQSENSAYPTDLRFGLFCNFLGIFGINSFAQRLVKLMEIENLEGEDLMSF